MSPPSDQRSPGSRHTTTPWYAWLIVAICLPASLALARWGIKMSLTEPADCSFIVPFVSGLLLFCLTIIGLVGVSFDHDSKDCTMPNPSSAHGNQPGAPNDQPETAEEARSRYQIFGLVLLAMAILIGGVSITAAPSNPNNWYLPGVFALSGVASLAIGRINRDTQHRGTSSNPSAEPDTRPSAKPSTHPDTDTE